VILCQRERSRTAFPTTVSVRHIGQAQTPGRLDRYALRVSTPHPEKIIRILRATVELLDEPDRLLVLTRLTSEFANRAETLSAAGNKFPEHTKNGPGSSGTSRLIGAPLSRGCESLRAFVRGKDPQSPRERLLCLLYWHTRHLGNPTARNRDLDELNGLAGGASYSASAGIAESAAARTELQLIQRSSDSGCPPQWHLTELGARVVEALPNRLVATAAGLTPRPAPSPDESPLPGLDRFGQEPTASLSRPASDVPSREQALLSLLDSLGIRGEK
jgi:hypothetical protein